MAKLSMIRNETEAWKRVIMMDYFVVSAMRILGVETFNKYEEKPAIDYDTFEQEALVV